MEPYRSTALRCPTCATESPLREFRGRLACDECHGLLIGEADFIASNEDLGPATLTLKITRRGDDAAAPIRCPRCERPMGQSKITLEPINVSADALHCERDGLWLTERGLTAVFARVGRRIGAFGGTNYNSGRIGLDGLPVSRHGPASGSLAISDWHKRPRKRAPTATPINLYRDQRLACPACTTPELRFYGDRYRCEQCAGTFVQNAALEAMVMDMLMQAWELPAPSGSLGTRACPVCTTPMIVEDLERVSIDRCGEHGVWFDPDELAVTLENASLEPRGVRAWLRSLFR